MLAEEFLTGIHPGWARLLAGTPGLLDAAHAALVVVERCLARGEVVVPEPRHILEALKFFDPDDTNAVIIAQEPYNTIIDSPGGEIVQAQGLCFSLHPDALVEPSLNVICGAVVADSGIEFGDNLPRLHDLRFWAAQGVLMLNRALTTLRGQTKAHQDVWAPFTALLVHALCVKVRRPIVFLLWGEEARQLANAVTTTGHHALEWTHPNDAARFDRCQHFLTTNHILTQLGRRPITWLPHGTVIACDGSCPKNGSADAIAAFGVVCTVGPLAGMRIGGPVRPTSYAWINPADPLQGFGPVSAMCLPERPVVTPTNNRAEFLGLCNLLLALCRAGTPYVEVIYDSEYAVKSITEWHPKRLRKGGNAAAQAKNYDLIVIAYELLTYLQRRATVVLVHVNSHKPKPKPPPANSPKHNDYLVTLRRWHANDEADILAGGSIKSESISFSAPFWFPHT
jgi:uracil-DNA glycosylase